MSVIAIVIYFFIKTYFTDLHHLVHLCGGNVDQNRHDITEILLKVALNITIIIIIVVVETSALNYA